MPKDRSVFISYRRGVSDTEAQAVSLYLRQKGYDVFLDVVDMPSGKFGRAIYRQIRMRTFFLPILMPDTLKRCINKDGSDNKEDWFRRENEYAMYKKRHIIPILMERFDFSANQAYLTGRLQELSDYNGIPIFTEYFLAGLEKLDELMTQYLEADSNPVTVQPDSPISLSFNAFDLLGLSSEQQEAKRLYDEAMDAFEKDDLPTAIRLFTESIHVVPNYAPAFGHRAIARKTLGDIDGAIADYTRAIQFSENYPFYAEYYYHNRGIAFHKKGNFDRAIEDYTDALNLNPQFADAYSRRGTSKAAKGDLSGAIRDYTAAMEIAPHDEMPVVNRGVAYSQLGDLHSAIKDYNLALSINPSRWEAYSNLGEAQIRLSMFEQATANLEMAISLSPDQPWPYHSLMSQYLEQGRYKDALLVCDRALEQFAPDAGLYHHRGWIYYKIGNLDEAIKYQNKALELDPTYPQAHNDLGLALAMTGEIDGAIKHFGKAIEYHHPKLNWPYANRADARASLGDFAGALSDCSEAIKIDASYPNAFRIRAEVHRQLNNVDEAIDDYQKYIELGGWQKYNDREYVEAIIRSLRTRR